MYKIAAIIGGVLLLAGVALAGTVTSLGTTTTPSISTLPAVSIDGVPAAKIENPEVNFSDIIYDCVVGNRFWLDKALTLDIPHNRILVSVAPAAKP